MGDHNMIETKHVTEVSDDDVQEFFDSESHPQNNTSDLVRELTGAADDGALHSPPAAQSDLSPRNPLIADNTSRPLSDEEKQILNNKLDRLMAAIGSGRELSFAQDSQTGNVDIAAIRERGRSDTNSVEDQIAAHVENFGNIMPPGSRREVLRSETSVAKLRSDSNATSRTNAWERAVAAADVRYALRALEPGSAAGDGNVVSKNTTSEESSPKKDRGRFLTFMGGNGPEVCAISPIPLSFVRSIGTSTPSVHSTGSEVDCSSPLFEKSAQAWLRKSHSGSHSPASDGREPQNVRRKESILAWLEGVEPPPQALVPKKEDGIERAFGVFNDGDASRSLVSKQIPRYDPAYKALKDVSNLRRPGYLQHNSFAQPTQSSAVKERAFPSRSPAKGFGGAVDPESRRDYIESRWPGLMSRRKQNPIADAPESSKRPEEEKRKSQGLVGDKKTISAAQQPLQHDPVRAAHFELALARLEGRAPPGQYSPPRRNADRNEDYGSSVELEHLPWRIREPRPTRPFAQLSEQVVTGQLVEGEPRSDADRMGDEEKGIGLDG